VTRYTPNAPAIVKARREGLTIQEIAKKLRHSRRIVSRVLREHDLQSRGPNPDQVRKIIKAYITPDFLGVFMSYRDIAKLFHTSIWRVTAIIQEYAPEHIRTGRPRIPGTTLTRPRLPRLAEKSPPKPSNPDALTLTNLGLYTVGPCAACGTEMVSETREYGINTQVCCAGLDFSNRGFARRVG